jgi:dTDP-4-amino-4,6-dideoxygalactose transaminase
MVIEDAACAIGSAYQDRKIGLPHSFMACFSFHPRKILTTGEGGMLTTADEQVAARLRRLRQHAMTTSDLARHQSKSIMTEGYDEVGFNYRMTDMQAAIGLVQLGRLDGFLARRRALALRYSEELGQLGWLTPPREPVGHTHNFQSYMVRVKPDAPISRDDLMQRLLERGISTRRGVMSIHREPPYRDEKWHKALRHSEAVTDQGMILPLFHQMTEQEQAHIIESVLKS